tara:strand:+ start:136 stop:315 length:180 start_codon:yes stop_codon:yes gene_type:complete
MQEQENKKIYTVDDVILLGYNLTPIKCKYCESLEVVYNQYIGDGCCQDCGEWQTEEEEN